MIDILIMQDYSSPELKRQDLEALQSYMQRTDYRMLSACMKAFSGCSRKAHRIHHLNTLSLLCKRMKVAVELFSIEAARKLKGLGAEEEIPKVLEHLAARGIDCESDEVTSILQLLEILASIDSDDSDDD